MKAAKFTAAILLGVDACHNPWCLRGLLRRSRRNLRNGPNWTFVVELRGLEPRRFGAKMPYELR